MDVQQWSRRLGIKAEDRRKLWLMVPVFLLCGIAETLNYNGFMTLFNQRFGSSNLPYVYMAEAVILPLEAWFMTWLSGRLSKPGLMRAMYAIMTGIVLLNALILLGMRVTGEDYRFIILFFFIVQLRRPAADDIVVELGGRFVPDAASETVNASVRGGRHAGRGCGRVDHAGREPVIRAGYRLCARSRPSFVCFI